MWISKYFLTLWYELVWLPWLGRFLAWFWEALRERIHRTRTVVFLVAMLIALLVAGWAQSDSYQTARYQQVDLPSLLGAGSVALGSNQGRVGLRWYATAGVPRTMAGQRTRLGLYAGQIIVSWHTLMAAIVLAILAALLVPEAYRSMAKAILLDGGVVLAAALIVLFSLSDAAGVGAAGWGTGFAFCKDAGCGLAVLGLVALLPSWYYWALCNWYLNHNLKQVRMDLTPFETFERLGKTIRFIVVHDLVRRCANRPFSPGIPIPIQALDAAQTDAHTLMGLWPTYNDTPSEQKRLMGELADKCEAIADPNLATAIYRRAFGHMVSLAKFGKAFLILGVVLLVVAGAVWLLFSPFGATPLPAQGAWRG